METSYRDKLLHFAFRYGAIIVILGVFASFAIKLEYFFSGSNIADILRSISIVTFVAIGVTFSLIVDGFDLSVGSTVSLTTVVTASLMVWYEMPLFIVIIVPLLIGFARLEDKKAFSSAIAIILPMCLVTIAV